MAMIGFIGLGNMGSGMVANLVRAGHDVRGFDLDDATRSRVAEEAGCTAAGSLAQAVADADAVLTMLPAGTHVRAVYTGQDGVFAHAPAGALCLDCSTIDVQSARDVSGQASARGFAMVDAPVSGGVAAAQAGTLTFMVGGTANAFDRAQPILSAMGKAVIHAGEAGAGQAAKICNNMLLAIGMLGTCEAFILAEKLGLDAQKFYDIASKASGQSWSMTSYCPVPGVGPDSPADHEFAPGFAGAMMLKDLNLAQDAARTAGASTPLGGQSQALYAMFAAMGGDTRDFSGIIQMLAGRMTPAQNTQIVSRDQDP